MARTLTETVKAWFAPTKPEPELKSDIPVAPDWQTWKGDIWGPPTPGSNVDFAREVKDSWTNGIVGLCVGYVQRHATAARLIVEKLGADDEYSPVSPHPFIERMQQPNRFYNWTALFQASILSYMVDGNAYWRIERDANGMPVSFWFIHHADIDPMGGNASDNFLTHYRLRIGGKAYDLPIENVFHVTFGRDPKDLRRGLSPLKTLYREIASDNEGTTYNYSMLKNLGVPGPNLTPADPTENISDPDAKALRELWQVRFTGDNRFKAFISNKRLKIEYPQITPESMALDQMFQRPEDRIPASFGLNAMALGLTAGANAKTYANYGESRDAAYEGGIVPLEKAFGDAMTQQLLPLYNGGDSTERVGWDRGDVPAAQEDETALYARATQAYNGGFITLNEARKMIGQKPLKGPEGDQRKPESGLQLMQQMGGGNPTLHGSGPNHDRMGNGTSRPPVPFNGPQEKP